MHCSVHKFDRTDKGEIEAKVNGVPSCRVVCAEMQATKLGYTRQLALIRCNYTTSSFCRPKHLPDKKKL